MPSDENRITAMTTIIGGGAPQGGVIGREYGDDTPYRGPLAPYCNATIRGARHSGRTTQAVAYMRSLASSPGQVGLLIITDDISAWLDYADINTLFSARLIPQRNAKIIPPAKKFKTLGEMRSFTKSVHTTLQEVIDQIDEREKAMEDGRTGRWHADDGTTVIIIDDYDAVMPCISQEDKTMLARIIREGEPLGSSVIMITRDDPIMNTAMYSSARYQCEKDTDGDGNAEYTIRSIPW